MRVATITVQDECNYGAALQAYALVAALRAWARTRR